VAESTVGLQPLAAGVRMLTKSRVQHVKSHAVALFRAGDCHEPLITIVLRLIYFYDASRHLPDLVDFGASFANDGTNHVIRNEDLLSQRLTGHVALHLLAVGSVMDRRTDVTCGWMRLHLACVASAPALSWIVNWHGIWLLLRMWWAVRLSIRRLVHMMRPRILSSSVIFTIAVVPTCWLRQIGDDLHAARHYPYRSTASGCIRRCRWTSKALVELLKQRTSDIICCDVDCISHAHDDKGAFRGQRQACI
jgi:hypothetical protein